MYKDAFPRGWIESSCWGEKSSGEEGKRGRGKEEGTKGRDWKEAGIRGKRREREVKEKIIGKEVYKKEDGEGNQVSGNFIHLCT